MDWATKIAAHDRDDLATRYAPQVWREPRPEGFKQPDDTLPGPHGYPFRTCSYCGSIHPEDLYKLLTDGPPTVRMHGADWKYGWPHKFYVEGIPNPIAGQQVCDGSRHIGANEPTEEDRRQFSNWRKDERGYWRGEHIGVAPDSTHAKFYNLHLRDLDDEAFALFAPVLSRHSGIDWFKNAEGLVMFRAPREGFQKV